MTTSYISRTSYRAVGDDNKVLCESDDLHEVLTLAKGQPFKLLVKTERTVVSTWAQMKSVDFTKLMEVHS